MTKKQYSVKEVFDTHIKDGVVPEHTGFLLLYDLVRYFRPKRASHSISLLELIGRRILPNVRYWGNISETCLPNAILAE